LPLSNRRPIHKTPQARWGRGIRDGPRSITAARVAITLGTGVLAAGAWLVARLFLPERFDGVASFSAAWIALYPAAHFVTGGPAWSHVVGGAVVILFWVLIVTMR
jgi:hypothetical protein